MDPAAIESPPLSDVGLPRTPSPSAASVATPPLAHAPELRIPLKYQRKSKTGSEKHYKKKFCERNWEFDCDELLSYSNSSVPAADAAGNGPPALSTPVSNAMSTSAAVVLGKSGKSPKEKSSPHHNSINASSNANASSANASYNHHHKSSKFRPKGKDWDWSLDSRSNTGDTTTAMTTTTNGGSGGGAATTTSSN